MKTLALSLLLTLLMPYSQLVASSCAGGFRRPSFRAIKDLTDFKVGTYNVAKLSFGNDARSHRRIRDVTKQILLEDLDVVAFQEMGDLAALRKIATIAGDQHRLFFIEGQKERKINFAMLVKADLPFSIEILSHKSRLFPRDLPVVLFREANRQVSMVMFIVHLKSKKERMDQISQDIQRQAQILAMAELYNHYWPAFGRNAAFLMLGDFNSELAQLNSDFTSLWMSGFRNSLELTANTPSVMDRATHHFRKSDVEVVHQQIDGILLDSSLQPGLRRSYVSRSIDSKPSDHDMVVVEIDISTLGPNGN